MMKYGKEVNDHNGDDNDSHNHGNDDHDHDNNDNNESDSDDNLNSTASPINYFNEDFLGPNCLYKLLESRSSGDKVYLNRNLLYKDKLARKIPTRISVSFNTIMKDIKLHNNAYIFGLVSVNLTNNSISSPIIKIHDVQHIMIDDSYDNSIINLKVDPMAFLDKNKYHNSNLLLIVNTIADVAPNEYNDEIEHLMLSYIRKCATSTDNKIITKSQVCILELTTKNLLTDTSHKTDRSKYMRSMQYVIPCKSMKITLAKLTNGQELDDNNNIDINICIRYNESIIRSSLRKLKRKHEDIECSSTDRAIFFHYVFKDENNGLLDSCVEKSQTIKCPFCEFSPSYEERVLDVCPVRVSGELIWTATTENYINRLFDHMKASHMHFKYDLHNDNNRNLHVIVVRDRDQDGGLTYKKSIIDNYYYGKRQRRRKLPLRIVPLDFSENEGHTVTPSYARNRLDFTDRISSSQFYHATVGCPAIEDEFLYYSDDDIDYSKTVMHAINDMSEFEEMSAEEKRFMKIWNIHIESLHVFADHYIIPACELFIRRYGVYILEHGLRHNLLVHLMNLYDSNLICAEEVLPLMTELDLLKMREGNLIQNENEYL